MREDWRWVATLAGGSQIPETALELRDPALSPWRKLERMAAEAGTEIASAAQAGPELTLGLESNGFPLECGQGFHTHLSFDGTEPRSLLYRFVCRLEPTRRVWALVCPETGGVWLLEGPPGEPMCPDPLAVS